MLQPANPLPKISTEIIVIATSTKLSLDVFALLVVEAFLNS